jgi:hypothetical protein
MPEPFDPHQNHLLAALPAHEYSLLLPDLEHIPMALGNVIYTSGSELHYVYFPTTTIVSLLYDMENGATAEIAGVGNEGVVGVSLFMGGATTPSRAVVQCAGHAYRMKAKLLMCRAFAEPAAALYPGADYTDVPDRSVQPASFGRPATVPLAAVNAGSLRHK